MRAKKKPGSVCSTGAGGAGTLSRATQLLNSISPSSTAEHAPHRFFHWSFQDAEREYLRLPLLTTTQANNLQGGTVGERTAQRGNFSDIN